MFNDPSEPPEGDTGKRRLASVLVADICGYSALAERDESLALAVVRRVSALLTTIATGHAGRLFHEAADGFFFEFASANQSMLAAREMLLQVSGDTELAQLHPIEIRIGMHLGDVQVEETGNLMGHGVNLAARLQQNADPGSILASSNLVAALSQRPGRFWSKRKLSLKNIKRPVIAFNIRERRSWSLAVRDLTSIMPGRVFGGIATLFAAMSVGAYMLVTEPIPDPGPLDKEAVNASLQPLMEAGRPIDDMVSALIRTNDFEQAVADLRQQHARTEAQLTREQSLDLLHQIAAISVNRDATAAEQIYQDILRLDPYDAEALLQMSKILRRRDFDDLASANLTKALNSPTLTDRMRIRIAIERVNLERSVVSDTISEDRFIRLAEDAAASGFNDLALQAEFNAVRVKYRAISKSESEGSLTPAIMASYEGLIDRAAGIADQQIEMGVFYDVSETLATLSTIQNHISDYQASTDTLTRALEIEQSLRRPVRMMAVHANLAYANVAWSKQLGSSDEARLSEAERQVEIVRDLSRREGLTSRDYYNWYILALVEDQRGNAALACSHFEKAIRAWPEKFLTDADAEDMASELGCSI